MLISDSSLKSDPRVMCGLVARTALFQLANEKRQRSGEVYASTLLRLLNSYRIKMPDVTHHKGVADFYPFDLTSVAEWHQDVGQSAVLEAVDRTRAACRPQADRAGFAHEVSEAIALAFGLRAEKASSVQVEFLKSFLQKLSAELKTA